MHILFHLHALFNIIYFRASREHLYCAYLDAFHLYGIIFTALAAAITHRHLFLAGSGHGMPPTRQKAIRTTMGRTRCMKI